jgi:hypothetical protein
MLREYAVVRLKRADATIPVPVGSQGTVLIVHSSTPTAYEVEFIDDSGKSLGTYTIEEVNLEEVKNE